jgi:hypothetical protein
LSYDGNLTELEPGQLGKRLVCGWRSEAPRPLDGVSRLLVDSGVGDAGIADSSAAGARSIEAEGVARLGGGLVMEKATIQPVDGFSSRVVVTETFKATGRESG